MGTTENTATLVAAYEAFGRGDIPAIIAMNSTDTVWEIHSGPGSPLDGTFKGHDGLGEFFGLVGTVMEFAKFEMAPVAADGNMVIAMGEQEYTVKATGKTVTGPLVHVNTFDSDGKIIRFEEFESNVGDAWQ